MDDELRTMVAQLIKMIEGERAVNAEERAINAQFRAEMEKFQVEVRVRLEGLDVRLNEQGRYIAALIPTHLAAVPSKPAA